MSERLFFRYGTMGCGKSTSLLQVQHNYKTQGLDTLVIKPSFDDRDGDEIQARIGIKAKVDMLVSQKDSIFDLVSDHVNEVGEVACVLVDEANFLTVDQARELWLVATLLSIPVIAYGLRVDYRGEGFPASKELLTLAHRIEELKTVDQTGKKCTMHLRSIGGEYVFEGEGLIVGDIQGSERYESCTSETWLREYMKYKNTKEQIDYRGGMV